MHTQAHSRKIILIFIAPQIRCIVHLMCVLKVHAYIMRTRCVWNLYK